MGAQAGRDQGKLWEMHDGRFDHQAALSAESHGLESRELLNFVAFSTQ
jgi:hypothetical protein